MKILDPPNFHHEDLVIKAWCHGCADVVRAFLTVELMDGLHIVLCIQCIYEMGLEIAERFEPIDSQA